MYDEGAALREASGRLSDSRPGGYTRKCSPSPTTQRSWLRFRRRSPRPSWAAPAPPSGAPSSLASSRSPTRRVVTDVVWCADAHQECRSSVWSIARAARQRAEVH
eukprot:5916669-Pyramimonas_sp.AAC.2